MNLAPFGGLVPRNAATDRPFPGGNKTSPERLPAVIE